MNGWARFALVQLIMLAATVIGWFVLIPFCLAQAWEPVISTLDPKRAIDKWKWEPLNLVAGNREDGVSGARALIWNHTGTARVPYMPNAHPAWRAYLWSGWRNSCDNLKYVFAMPGGPFIRKQWRGWYAKAGFQPDSGYPVLSVGRV